MPPSKSEDNSSGQRYKGYADLCLVISVEAARSLLNRSDVIFIDTRNYWKYVKGHIPGAFNLELYAFHWIDTSKRGIDAFLKQMEFLFSSVGVTRNRQEVIFYQNNSGYDAARGVWLLNYMGHTKARLLDGGLNAWRRRNFPTSTEDPKLEMSGHFQARPNYSVIATRELIASRLKQKSTTTTPTTIVDSRSPGEYSAKYRRALHAGHVPSSINKEWKMALRRDGTLKDAAQLRRVFSLPELTYGSIHQGSGSTRRAGKSQSRELITYCQSGYRAAHSWLVLRLLGYSNVRNYLGSWYEWGNYGSGSPVAFHH
ncbi:MAG TPA: rhodanese-like domain-containing protein [Nitrososphaerales archaeon]|nr:rhodanese-like domain-containing protein [Nitrososphaerales archaeon]